ncbi:hypothetical protein [Aquitalea palustris]|uniref:hypothetical protein n=1 Tax=Aquitalea palustris TaxID=2480983 RepID=UPI001CEFB3F7|nr:hypothetical protein [Aquitalea palustris]
MIQDTLFDMVMREVYVDTLSTVEAIPTTILGSKVFSVTVRAELVPARMLGLLSVTVSGPDDGLLLINQLEPLMAQKFALIEQAQLQDRLYVSTELDIALQNLESALFRGGACNTHASSKKMVQAAQDMVRLLEQMFAQIAAQ